MRIHVLQHVPFEGPAAIADWAGREGHSITSTRLFEGASPPGRSEFDWLVIMGGPMSIHDEDRHPWLTGEKTYVRAAIDAGKTVVGVCLGAQLIADALGARVSRNPEKEIGWFPVELTRGGRESDTFGFLPGRFDVFHWHGETFDLPAGSLHLARSEACLNQAFLYDGRVLGLQFHVESTARSVRDIVANCGDEIVPGRFIQSAERMLAAADEDYGRINQALFGILDRLPE